MINAGTALFITVMTFMVIAGWLLNSMIRTRRAPAIADGGEAARQLATLRDENQRLNERLAVLERIATDPGARAAREIEYLRQGD